MRLFLYLITAILLAGCNTIPTKNGVRVDFDSEEVYKDRVECRESATKQAGDNKDLHFTSFKGCMKHKGYSGGYFKYYHW